MGQRAKQIEGGAQPFVAVEPNIIDSYLIAENELREKKIPFIIRRPIPNGGFELVCSCIVDLLLSLELIPEVEGVAEVKVIVEVTWFGVP